MFGLWYANLYICNKYSNKWIFKFKSIIMKSGLKILVNTTLISSITGFAAYLLLIIVGFMGCCLEISSQLFGKIVLITLLVAAVAFGLCIYNNCICHKSHL